MRTPALPSPRRIAVGAGLALLAAGLTPLAASANPAGTGLVISEVYGGGGNAGATFKPTSSSSTTRPTAAIDARRHVAAVPQPCSGTGARDRRDPCPTARYPAAGALPGQRASRRHRRCGVPADARPTHGTGISMARRPTAASCSSTAPAAVDPDRRPRPEQRDVIDLVGYGTATSVRGHRPPRRRRSRTRRRPTAPPRRRHRQQQHRLLARARPVAHGASTGEPPVPARAVRQHDRRDPGHRCTRPLDRPDRDHRRASSPRSYPRWLNGFYIQTAAPAGTDATPGASDAIFVYGGTGFDQRPGARDRRLGPGQRCVSRVLRPHQITADRSRHRAGHPARPRSTPLASAYPNDGASARRTRASCSPRPTPSRSPTPSTNNTSPRSAWPPAPRR